MAEYIDRDAAISIADEAWSKSGNVIAAQIWAKLQTLPTADVEPVVRCKDCHFFESDHFETVNGVSFITAHNVCTRWGRGCQTAEDGFCFMGIRGQGTRMDGGDENDDR